MVKVHRQHGYQNTVVIAAAGIASAKDDNVVMAEVMIDYILSLGTVSREQAVALCGKPFTTDGEAKALAAYVKEHADICRVLVCVKWWHAPRTIALIRLRFHDSGIGGIKISKRSCQSFVEHKHKLREFFGAVPINFLRLFQESPRKAFRFAQYLIPELLTVFS